MNKLINSLKNHITAIIVSSAIVLILAVTTLFTLICFQYFDNLRHASSLEIVESKLSGPVEAISDDLLFVTLATNNNYLTENSDEKKLEDEEKDKEEEAKAEEEAKKEEEAKAEEEAKKEDEKNKEINKETEKEKNKTQQTNTQNAYPYYIKINKSANTVTIYTKDSNGNYTVPYKALVCSTRLCFSK